MSSIIKLSILLFLPVLATAQMPVPAKAQSQKVIIIHGKAHLGNGKVLQNCLIEFDKGKLTRVAEISDKFEASPDAKVIDATGKQIYPGLIAMNTQIGLVEIDAARATVDDREVGDYNPSVRSLPAYNTDSYVTPTLRSNGVLLAQVVPEGGTVSGTSSVMELDGWNWEDAAYKIDEGMHLHWPSMIIQSQFGEDGPTGSKKNENYGKQVAEINSFFREGQAYSQKSKGGSDPKNLKMEALRPLFEEKKTLYIHANKVKEMTEGAQTAKRFGLKCVIVGGQEAWMITGFLKDNDVAVILYEPQSLPVREDDDIDQPFKNATLLQKAGVQYCISKSGGSEAVPRQRNLAFQAGQCIAFGLDYETALMGITLNAAKILGIDATVGSIEEGKDATLLISEGDLLDMRSSVVERAFIRGNSYTVLLTSLPLTTIVHLSRRQ